MVPKGLSDMGSPYPVVLNKADIMGLSINAKCLQAAQIQLLGVARIRLHDDLKLSVALHSVGVVAIPAVIWPH
ncbi:MAG: hypothetical protein FRX49_00414 [Trebouxia sp. A1-2]|nr:MAG: hypothetical protein FRX49_00414 [Trebouxia sp. A1-2]